MAPISMTLSDLECHFSCLTLSNPYSSMNVHMTRLDYDVCVHRWERSMVFNHNCFPRMKDYLRLVALQAVRYAVGLRETYTKETA